MTEYENELIDKELNELKKKYNELELAYKQGQQQFETVKSRYLQICEAHANKCMQFDILSDQYRASQGQ